MEKTSAASTDRILRLPEVCAVTGLARPTIYLYVRRGDFPQPIKLTVKAVGWRQSEIQNWIESRQSASQGAPSTPSTASTTKSTEAA